VSVGEPVTLTSPDGGTRAELHPDLNLLCGSLRHRGVELLDPTHGLDAYRERGATLGVPLLYPWANRLAGFGYEAAGARVALPEHAPLPTDPNGLPIHGIEPARLRWSLERDDGHELTATLAFAAPELLELFPFAHELRSTVTVGDGTLTIATTLTATGDQDVPVSFGYHPYLRLPGGDRGAWEVTLGAARRLVLDERMIPTGAREPVAERRFTLGERSLDDGYDGVEQPASFTAASDHGTVSVELRRGYPFAQVYAPPGKDFICFEPMTAPANALRSGDGLTVVAPGDSYVAEFAVVAVLP
jgi:aldose 1-epimerase